MANQQSGLSQSQDAILKSYASRLKEALRTMLENFEEIARLGKCEKNSHLTRFTQSERDSYEMNVRAANMVRAGESLMKLIADIKHYIIFNDFSSVNEILDANNQLCRIQAVELDRKLFALRDDIATHLYELEEEYYMSVYK